MKKYNTKNTVYEFFLLRLYMVIGKYISGWSRTIRFMYRCFTHNLLQVALDVEIKDFFIHSMRSPDLCVFVKSINFKICDINLLHNGCYILAYFFSYIYLKYYQNKIWSNTCILCETFLTCSKLNAGDFKIVFYKAVTQLNPLNWLKNYIDKKTKK